MTTLFLAHATVTFLLRFWEEEEAFITTLHTIQVIICVEESQRDHQCGREGTICLSGGPRIGCDHDHDNQLDEGQLWQRWHHKALLNILDFVGGLWGVLFHSLAVTWHFYFILRN